MMYPQDMHRDTSSQHKPLALQSWRLIHFGLAFKSITPFYDLSVGKSYPTRRFGKTKLKS